MRVPSKVRTALWKNELCVFMRQREAFTPWTNTCTREAAEGESRREGDVDEGEDHVTKMIGVEPCTLPHTTTPCILCLWV